MVVGAVPTAKGSGLALALLVSGRYCGGDVGSIIDGCDMCCCGNNGIALNGSRTAAGCPLGKLGPLPLGVVGAGQGHDGNDVDISGAQRRKRGPAYSEVLFGALWDGADAQALDGNELCDRPPFVGFCCCDGPVLLAAAKETRSTFPYMAKPSIPWRARSASSGRVNRTNPYPLENFDTRSVMIRADSTGPYCWNNAVSSSWLTSRGM